MTWTYSGDPTDSTKDALRVLLGDTDSTDQLLSDEELQYFADQWSNIYQAAAAASKAIAGRFARFMDKEVGDLKIAYSQRYAHYSNLCDEFTAQGTSMLTVAPYAGGISKADKETNQSNTDRVAPDFVKDQFDSEMNSVPELTFDP